MATWMVMPAHGSCQCMGGIGRHAGVGSSPNNGKDRIKITRPVGQGGVNLPNDVKAIQQALNDVPLAGELGGALPPLVVDGICGPKTRAAIVKFQREQLKRVLSFFDGLVEPDGPTLLKLNEILAPVTVDDLDTKVKAALPIVGASLRAARENVRIAREGGPRAAIAIDRLNRHFKLNTMSESDRQDAVLDLFFNYDHFNTVMTKPETFQIDAVDNFEVDHKNPRIALTTGGGFFSENLLDEDGERMDRIRLGMGFFSTKVSTEFAAHILVHEVAHFVGSRRGRFLIEDFGRGWFDDTFIKPLPARQRILNADSYASFARECLTNSPVKPTFVTTAPGGLGGAR